ncbi:MAG: hypothetical protein NTV87_10420 [Ignavibacteriae bacterium]|nr:hypothetical protein [Ignavibacteriota bacterium]
MKKTNKVLPAILTIAMLFAFGVSKSFTQVTDKDDSTYKTITISKQIWMAENLNVEHYRNGDPIPQVQDKEEWDNQTTGAWCYYENNSGNGTTYGRLYNWYAVSDPRGLAPDGWHIPTNDEWTKLINYLGGAEVAGEKMKTTSGWDENGNGTNTSGFNAIPGGYRNHEGYFINIGRNALFWTSTEFNSTNILFRNVIGSIPDVYNPNYTKDFGLSVRCVKDN